MTAHCTRQGAQYCLPSMLNRQPRTSYCVKARKVIQQEPQALFAFKQILLLNNNQPAVLRPEASRTRPALRHHASKFQSTLNNTSNLTRYCRTPGIFDPTSEDSSLFWSTRALRPAPASIKSSWSYHPLTPTFKEDNFVLSPQLTLGKGDPPGSYGESNRRNKVSDFINYSLRRQQ